jgi:hypothetical protein
MPRFFGESLAVGLLDGGFFIKADFDCGFCAAWPGVSLSVGLLDGGFFIEEDFDCGFFTA